MSVVQRDSPGVVPPELENGDPEFTPTRRSFLKAAGFTFGAMAASSCRAPEVNAIPYIEQPEGIVPGRAAFYATTCGACEARCGLLVTAAMAARSRSKADNRCQAGRPAPSARRPSSACMTCGSPAR
jgi:anaerobic selenocysteine-containing dehydrogenase